ncbi:MAG: hypoxanthine phosphoribosyltransferase [Chlorobi bacterium]|nr:hypoxanthine phosphoribosyltransferase [Chlorobiota bacterium]
MKRVKLLDKEFELSIPEADIIKAIKKVSDEIDRDLRDKDPLLICVLNGSFMFASDLMKEMSFNCEISFVKLSSYEGTSTTGKVKELIGLNEDIKGRHVVILEDIVDSGITVENIVEQLKKHDPLDVRVATMLFKPEAYEKDMKLDYIGLKIPNDFIVGYGLDYNGYGRNLRNIYTVVDE